MPKPQTTLALPAIADQAQDEEPVHILSSRNIISTIRSEAKTDNKENTFF
jgi:hypothetical protein